MTTLLSSQQLGMIQQMESPSFQRHSVFSAFVLFVSFFTFHSLGFSSSTPQEWLVLQSQGDVSAWIPEQALPKSMDVGMRVDPLQSVQVGSTAFCVIGNRQDQQLLFSSLSSVTWFDTGAESGLKLQNGALRYNGPEKTNELFCIEVPYGIVASTSSSFNLFLKSNSTALLDLVRGEAEVRQGEQTKVLMAPKLVLIERTGIREITDPLLPRMRAIFDFREKPKTWPEAQQLQQTQKDADDEQIQGESEDVKLRGKASNAKLVEGEGSGEGEYHWDFSLPLGIYLVPLFIGVLIALYRWHLTRKKPNEASGNLDKSNKNHDYETDDIMVIRGNLTANDPTLETSKVTHILGNVEDGAKIIAHHDLRIIGCFQGAQLTATAQVNIESGINGQGKAQLDIDGELHTAYISEAQVICSKKIVVEKAIRNAQIACDGDIFVQNKNILGGWVASATSVTTPGLGSDFCETTIILGEPASSLWKERMGREAQWSSKGEFNRKAFLRVMEEWVSALVTQGQAKLDQKKPLPGPVETRLDPSDLSKLQVRGFRKDDETP
jgi:hypothetical protein